jgi:hypothetical protein
MGLEHYIFLKAVKEMSLESSLRLPGRPKKRQKDETMGDNVSEPFISPKEP